MMVEKKKSILITNPSIAKDWDATKNLDFKIEDIGATDKNSFWWTCNCGTLFRQTPNNMVTLHKRGSTFGCGKCS